MQYPKDATSQSVYVVVVQNLNGASPGAPRTGLIFSNITNMRCMRDRAAAIIVTPVTLSSHIDSWTLGGFKEVPSTPGLYRVDLPDSAFADGSHGMRLVIGFGGVSDAAPVSKEFTLSHVPTSADEIVRGLAQTGTLSTTQMTTNLALQNADHYKDAAVIFRTGALQHVRRLVTASITDTGLTKLTFAAVHTAPSNGDAFILV